MQLKQTAESLWSDAKTYWKHPPAGKYMPFKEIAAYSVGGSVPTSSSRSSGRFSYLSVILSSAMRLVSSRPRFISCISFPSQAAFR